MRKERNRRLAGVLAVLLLLCGLLAGCIPGSAGEGGQEYILVVCGCTAVCAGHTHLKAAKHKFVINSREQLAAACEAIIKENEV